MDLKTIFTHPAFWGFCGGFFFFILSLISHFKTKREFSRYQKHLSDKLELEAKQYDQVRREKEAISKENENLRIRISQLSERPDQKVGRELEILARAEKKMVINAPGFAPAWEAAKLEASSEMDTEAQGKSLPKRIFSRFFSSGSPGESRPLLGPGSDDPNRNSDGRAESESKAS